MKLIILRNNLKEGFSAVERAVTETSNLPILKNILLSARGGQLNVSATNLELGVHKRVTGKVIEEGEITVPFAALHNIIANTDSERVSLETEKDTLNIKADNYHAKVQGLSANEFPIIPNIENAESFFNINSLILKESIGEIISAAQISEIRPEISGVFFDFQVSAVKLVATDSFRLAEKTIPQSQYQANFQTGFNIIIPLKTVQETTRIFSGDEPVHIFIDKNQILFKSNSVELISRLINGKYPDYEQIIPKTSETELVLNREKFMSAVKLVSSFSGKVNEVKLRMKKESKALEIYSASQSIGENTYLISVKQKGEPFEEVGFNWRYLVDGLKAMKSEEVFLGVNSNTKPATLKSPGDASYFYILMPIKAV